MGVFFGVASVSLILTWALVALRWCWPAAPLCSDYRTHGNLMDCGPGVSLCGILALRTGRGSGFYRSEHAMIHGLWPEVSPFGTSKCVKPADDKDAESLVCYLADDVWIDGVQLFQHEWRKHGTCAGVQNSTDYLWQACDLAAAPLKVMEEARAAGTDLNGAADQLQRFGHCVWSTDEVGQQIMLSTCAGPDGRWKLADIGEFRRVCATDS
mmetsp:Transcript_114/g.399  ORF Transcript_114/g.399 Transcript_114/m.399 type:complete len:211 (-) Transcript_114:229-861(-)